MRKRFLGAGFAGVIKVCMPPSVSPPDSDNCGKMIYIRGCPVSTYTQADYMAKVKESADDP